MRAIVNSCILFSCMTLSLKDVFARGDALVQTFYKKRNFPLMEELWRSDDEHSMEEGAAAFWKNKGLKSDDWLGLLKWHLSNIFSDSFLEPYDTIHLPYFFDTLLVRIVVLHRLRFWLAVTIGSQARGHRQELPDRIGDGGHDATPALRHPQPGAVLELRVVAGRGRRADPERPGRRGARRVPRAQTDPRGHAVARRPPLPAGDRLATDDGLEGGPEHVAREDQLGHALHQLATSAQHAVQVRLVACGLAPLQRRPLRISCAMALPGSPHNSRLESVR